MKLPSMQFYFRHEIWMVVPVGWMDVVMVATVEVRNPEDTATDLEALEGRVVAVESVEGKELSIIIEALKGFDNVVTKLVGSVS